MKRWLTVIGLSLACHAPEAAKAVRGSGMTPAPASAPARSSGTSATNPFAAHALPTEQYSWIEGRVEESIPAGSYVYLRVRTLEQTDFWVASLAITTPQSPHVRVLVLGRAEHFHSRRLERDFEPLLFGAVRRAASDEEPISKRN